MDSIKNPLTFFYGYIKKMYFFCSSLKICQPNKQELMQHYVNLMDVLAFLSKKDYKKFLKSKSKEKFIIMANNLIDYLLNACLISKEEIIKNINLYKNNQFYGLTLIDRIKEINLNKNNIEIINFYLKNNKKPMGIIVYTFPACGKTTLATKYNNCKDLITSTDKYILSEKQKTFSKEWLKGTERTLNKNYEKDYLNHLKQALLQFDFVLVSSKGLTLALKYGYTNYWSVYPEFNAKDEFVNRMETRGNNPKFISNYQNNWNKLLNYNYEKKAYKTYRLLSSQYLEDILKPYLKN